MALRLARSLDAHRQCQRQNRRQTFRYGRHGQGDGEQDDLAEAPEPLDHQTADGQREADRQDGDRDLVAELAEPALERRLARLDPADHGGELAHRALRARPGHLDVALAAHDQRAAEHLALQVLVDGQGFAGQDRLVRHHALAFDQAAVGRDAVAGLDAGDVAGNELVRRDLHQHSVAHDPYGRHGKRLEARQRLLGLAFLVGAETGVEDEDEARWQWTSIRNLLGAFVQPEGQIEGEREQQNVDERALELAEQPLPEANRLRLPAGHSVRARRDAAALPPVKGRAASGALSLAVMTASRGNHRSDRRKCVKPSRIPGGCPLKM